MKVHDCVACGDLSSVKKILATDEGKEVLNQPNERGLTPLQLAIPLGHVHNVSRQLLDDGSEGFEMFRFLVSEGANLYPDNHDFRNDLDAEVMNQLVQVVRSNQTTDNDKDNAQLMIALMQQKIQGYDMYVASAQEYNDLQAWTHKYFKDDYQDGSILATHALRTFEKIKVFNGA